MKTEALAFLVSIFAGGALCWAMLPLLRAFKAGQPILGYVDNHRSKSGTPTMGGFSFAVAACAVFAAFFARSDARLALVCAALALSFLAVGAFDDGIKIKTKKNEGLTVKQKIIFQTAISLIVSLFVYFKGHTDFFIPFFNVYCDLGFFAVPLCFFVFLATTNCVNLTDGLDGLAGGVCYVYFLIFYALIKAQIMLFPDNYVLPAEAENIARLCLVQAGALLGYLIFNTYKASVFMGDTGSLYLGGMVASTGILSGNAFFIAFIGATFVASGVSVLIQVAHYKRTKKRVFLMAPLHHHFEYKGYGESKICYCYKLVTLVLGVACALSLTI